MYGTDVLLISLEIEDDFYKQLDLPFRLFIYCRSLRVLGASETSDRPSALSAPVFIILLLDCDFDVQDGRGLGNVKTTYQTNTVIPRENIP